LVPQAGSRRRRPAGGLLLLLVEAMGKVCGVPMAMPWDSQVAALPLARTFPSPRRTRSTSPARTWPCLSPAVTELPTAAWNALITTITALHPAATGSRAGQRRGHRPERPAPARPSPDRDPRRPAPGHRPAPPPRPTQSAIAELLSVRPETINKHIRDSQHLLEQAGHTIQLAEQQLATLEDLYNLASTGHLHANTNHDGELMICKP
jgi:hypothetical protein